MPPPSTPESKPLSSHKALSFDVYGTIVQWEAGIHPHLLKLTKHLPASSPLRAPWPPNLAGSQHLVQPNPLIEAFKKYESKYCAVQPAMNFEELTRQSYRDLARELGAEVVEEDAEAAALSPGSWPAWPDSAAAMRRLGERYKLVALTNSSKRAIDAVLSGPLKDVKFDAVYFAEEIGAYKPSPKNFEYLIEGVKREFGVEKEDLLHVAHGFETDQVSAERFDIAHVWVERGVDNRGEASKEMKRMRVVPTLQALADEVENESRN